jgi:hypothetical protein
MRGVEAGGLGVADVGRSGQFQHHQQGAGEVVVEAATAGEGGGVGEAAAVGFEVATVARGDETAVAEEAVRAMEASAGATTPLPRPKRSVRPVRLRYSLRTLNPISAPYSFITVP